jgi:hypothetical protein
VTGQDNPERELLKAQRRQSKIADGIEWVLSRAIDAGCLAALVLLFVGAVWVALQVIGAAS